MASNEDNRTTSSHGNDSLPPMTTTSAGDSDSLGDNIGPYKLLSVLGEGGFGIVYLAEQERPIRRRVALKVIKPGMDSKQVIARFEAERQALALLDHPNIAHVFNAGTTELGRPYFVMEYVKGMPITQYCDRHRLTIEQRLKLFIDICEAVQHAHQKGIIHRDLKPSNILVARHEDKSVPMIIDFGVAKAISQQLTERTLYTEQGQFIGTPEYMSPEQAEMTAEQIDTRSDIYSLGVILYELLTGALPFDSKTLRGAGITGIRRVIRTEDPKTPSTRLSGMGEKAKEVADSRQIDRDTLTKSLKRELEWIPLKALRKEPERRYKTASELADDVRNYLKGDPLIAGPESLAYRVRKLVHRHASLLVSLILIILLTFVAMVGFVVSMRMYLGAEKARKQETVARDQAEQARIKEQEQRVLAQQQSERYRSTLYIQKIRLAESYHQMSAEPGIILQLLDSCPIDMRNWEWQYLWKLSKRNPVLVGHQGSIRSLSFSPDGKHIATGSWDNSLKIWDTERCIEIKTLQGHKGCVTSVEYSPDGKKIASRSRDGAVKLWNVASGQEIMTLQGKKTVILAIAYCPSGKCIASGNGDGTVGIWDAFSGNQISQFQGHEGAINSISYSPDGKCIVSGSSDNALKVLDTESGLELMTMQGHIGGVSSVDYSPDGKQIVSGSVDKTLKIWNAASGEEIMTLEGHKMPVCSVAFRPDNKWVVSSSHDKTLKIWDSKSGQELTTLLGHGDEAYIPERQRRGGGYKGIVYSCAFSPDGLRIASGGNDATLRIWDIEPKRKEIMLKGHADTFLCASFSPDGRRVVSGSDDESLKIWDSQSGEELMTLAGHKSWVFTVAYSPDGKKIISGSSDHSLKVWEAKTGRELITKLSHAPVTVAAFSPNGRLFVSSDTTSSFPRHGILKIWNAETGEEVMTLQGHEISNKQLAHVSGDSIDCVAFSPDSNRIITGSQDQTLKLWNIDSGQELVTLKGHRDSVWTVAFSPDGKRIVSGSGDNTLKIWDVGTGIELMTLVGHRDGIVSVSFSPDGKRIVSGSSNGTLKLWDSESGVVLLTLAHLEETPLLVSFTPNGKQIISVSSFNGDGKLTIW
ncbi:protein kinase [Planctomycetota bacterium]